MELEAHLAVCIHLQCFSSVNQFLDPKCGKEFTIENLSKFVHIMEVRSGINTPFHKLYT
jgi:hypothetical protein